MLRIKNWESNFTAECSVWFLERFFAKKYFSFTIRVRGELFCKAIYSNLDVSIAINVMSWISWEAAFPRQVEAALKISNNLYCVEESGMGAYTVSSCYLQYSTPLKNITMNSVKKKLAIKQTDRLGINPIVIAISFVT